MRNNTFNIINNKPTDIFGICSKCQSGNIKIVYGWHGVYYDLICKNNHNLHYSFKDKKLTVE